MQGGEENFFKGKKIFLSPLHPPHPSKALHQWGKGIFSLVESNASPPE